MPIADIALCLTVYDRSGTAVTITPSPEVDASCIDGWLPIQASFSIWQGKQWCDAAPLTGSTASTPIARLMLAPSGSSASYPGRPSSGQPCHQPCWAATMPSANVELSRARTRTWPRGFVLRPARAHRRISTTRPNATRQLSRHKFRLTGRSLAEECVAARTLARAAVAGALDDPLSRDQLGRDDFGAEGSA